MNTYYILHKGQKVGVAESHSAERALDTYLDTVGHDDDGHYEVEPTTGVTRPVTVTLTLEEWTAILARIAKPNEMSLLGVQIYNRAAASLGKQITEGAQ